MGLLTTLHYIGLLTTFLENKNPPNISKYINEWRIPPDSSDDASPDDSDAGDGDSESNSESEEDDSADSDEDTGEETNDSDAVVDEQDVSA